MTVATEDFAAWIHQADLPPSRLTPELDALLQAVYRFRQQQGSDYYSTRVALHKYLKRYGLADTASAAQAPPARPSPAPSASTVNTSPSRRRSLPWIAAPSHHGVSPCRCRRPFANLLTGVPRRRAAVPRGRAAAVHSGSRCRASPRDRSGPSDQSRWSARRPPSCPFSVVASWHHRDLSSASTWEPPTAPWPTSTPAPARTAARC